jgi:DNA-binding IclR family transcriptional regulator
LKTLSISLRAYLLWIANVRRGLITRTEIIDVLSRDEWLSPSKIAEKVRVTAGTVVYHLKNMEREDIVEREPEGSRWRLGPYNQTTLTSFLTTKTRKRKKKK